MCLGIFLFFIIFSTLADQCPARSYGREVPHAMPLRNNMHLFTQKKKADREAPHTNSSCNWEKKWQPKNLLNLKGEQSFINQRSIPTSNIVTKILRSPCLLRDQNLLT